MHKWLPVGLVVCSLLFAVGQFLPLPGSSVTYEKEPPAEEPVALTQTDDTIEPAEVLPVDNRKVVRHVPLPEEVRAIYMTSCVAGTPSFRDRLVSLIQSTELNAVMIDIKDYSGTISFAPATTSQWYPAWQNARCGARDMEEFISELHEKNIFVIGRITVFQDPFYASRNPTLAVQRLDQQTVWQDGKGLSFVDVAAQPFWDHIVDLAIESYAIGFDEINFDYIRYPSDGNMRDIYFPQSMAGEYGSDKQSNLEAFFAYLYNEMQNPENFSAVKHDNTGRSKPIPWTSADLFGMTTTNYDDLSIGQVQERAAPYFDFLAPMVYPSHYPNNYLGLGDPNDHPYEVVFHAMNTGVARIQSTTTRMQGFAHEPILETSASGTSSFTGLYTKPAYGPEKFRTWIQDFDYGGVYDAADVRAQIQASYDAGVTSWMIWAPSNVYTQAALLPAN